MTGGFTTSAAKLAAVRQELRKQGLDGMLLTRADRFQGEEVRGQDEYLAWLTGFTGSAGVALILVDTAVVATDCLLYTSPSPRDRQKSRMPSSA